MRPILFDFNGTLFADSAQHKAAWRRFAAEYGKTVSEEELVRFFLGRANEYILRYLFGEGLSKEQILALARKKEAMYREICLEQREGFHLVAGAESFLDMIRADGVNFTIATGSEAENVDFYFEHFHLSRWFDREKVILDDGTFPGKPAPDCYLRAAQVIGADVRDCVVFEDSCSGVLAANAAGASKIVMIGAAWEQDALQKALPTLPPVAVVATDFSEMPRIWKERLCR